MPEATVSQLPVYNPRPTIRIDEQEFERSSELLISMDMNEQEGGMSAMQLRFSNVASNTSGRSDFAFEDEAEIGLGSAIAVFSGDTDSPQEIFRGIVTGIEAEFPADAPPELLILAEDSLQQARMQRRTKTYSDASIAEIAEEIASGLGLTPVVSGFSNTRSSWVQLNESDLAFLRRLLRRFDGDVQVVGDELHVSPRSEVRRGEFELELFSQLQSVKFIADLTDQVTEVTVSGWDSARGERVSATSTGADAGPGEGRDGAGILRDRLVERSEHVGHIHVAGDDEAQGLADAVFDQHARRFVCAHGRSEGNAGLRVGSHVTLTGVSRRFENTYYVVASRHTYDVTRGYQTSFRAECSRLGNAE